MTQYWQILPVQIFSRWIITRECLTKCRRNLCGIISPKTKMSKICGVTTSSLNGYTAVTALRTLQRRLFHCRLFHPRPPKCRKLLIISAIEFDNDNQNLVALSSTFLTKEDYHKENPPKKAQSPEKFIRGILYNSHDYFHLLFLKLSLSFDILLTIKIEWEEV